MKRTSITEKMVLYFLALGIGSIIITGFFSFYTARQALLERTYDQLTSIRLTRQARIENFFSDRLRETEHFCKSETTKILSSELLGGNYQDTLSLLTDYDYFIFASGYYEGFIIFNTTGKIIFNYHNNSDFQDPALILNYKRKEGTLHQAFIFDYNNLRPNNNTTSQLLSVCPVQRQGITIAYIALVVKSETVNEMLLESGPSNGLGYSGETYLVGPDHFMRSQSRFIPNSIMNTRVLTIPVVRALGNSEGIAQVSDYRGIEVLSSYGRIKTRGLNWAILAEIDYTEAMASIYSIRNNILLLTLMTGVAFFVISFMISRRITRPLVRLKNAAIELGEGRLNTTLVIESNDEIGALTDAFNKMAVNLHEKDEALKIERINRLRSAIDGQDLERQRLSREMHDGIGQSLIAVRLRLGALENNVSEKIKKDLSTIISLTDNMIDEVRAISNALMPPVLAEFGLISAIRQLCNNLTETYGIKTTLDGEIPAQILGRKARLYIFRILQEAMNNTAKHSGASQLKILVQISENILYINISDDGKGFDMDLLCNNKGHGLNNIKERASLLKGQATIDSAENKGTEIKIEIPFNKTVL